MYVCEGLDDVEFSLYRQVANRRSSDRDRLLLKSEERTTQLVARQSSSKSADEAFFNKASDSYLSDNLRQLFCPSNSEASQDVGESSSPPHIGVLSKPQPSLRYKLGFVNKHEWI